MSALIRRSVVLGAALLALSGSLVDGAVFAQTSTAPVSKSVAPSWLERSNANTQLLLDVTARYAPERAGQLGVEGLDEKVIDLSSGYDVRQQQATARVAAELKRRLTSESDPLVRQDLEILIRAADQGIRGSELERKYELPYFNLAQLVFFSTQSLLDDQVAPARRPAALVRLKRYAGLEPGYQPLVVLAEARIRERRAQPGLLYPFRAEVEKNLANSATFIDGIDKLFAKYQIADYQQPLARLKAQLASYDAFVRKEILPKARADFREPPELYAFSLEQVGVDIPPEQLTAQAHAAFGDIQQKMQQLALQVAKAKGYNLSDYRDVIRELKKDQLVGDAILPHYQDRLKQIEQIIVSERLVTLPGRPARIVLASAAESAAQPAPHMRPPRLLGNKGEQGEFVLPLVIPAPPGAPAGKTERVNDFTFAAASWTLTAHEARPGHELQFASIIEKGVSNARAIYAFNSTNVEGWGLYSEAITYPFMPPEGQLISLQLRLLRAARAFLDPELQSGKVTPQEAMRVLTQDVVLSEPFANQEVERYTFRAPGQATAYFYGYTRLTDLRQQTEKLLGSRFDQQKFHDFILAQGLLPPALLRKAVIEQFVPAQNGATPRQTSP
ncbi:DUF885 domain-containing protein [Gloeobacter kilaueensis]|nr:DUF885 domain-containing protein [Gloeobacter kilaueensis]